MAEDPTDLNPLAPAGALQVNASPLQRPGQDTLLRTAVVGGPEVGGDRRVYLSRQLLGELLEMARTSSMGRVMVGRAGLRVDLYRRGDGHEYEVWTLIGDPPRPEDVPAFVRYASADWREG